MAWDWAWAWAWVFQAPLGATLALQSAHLDAFCDNEGGGLIIAAAPSTPAFDYVYDYYGTAALTRFSNGFMADPVKDFINFNWKLRQDAALE